MNPSLKVDAWNIIEDGFHPDRMRDMESIFSIGNGKLGQRANFEETYSGDSLQGSYMAGIYYPDKTKVGWWKNGYPEYFAKVLNATNWIGLEVRIGNDTLDLAKCKVLEFKRILNMREGILEREFKAETPSGHVVRVQASRFVSIAQKEVGAIRYSITSENFTGSVTLTPYLDLDVRNEDANYDEKFWLEVGREIKDREACITGQTKKSNFLLATGMRYELEKNGSPISPDCQTINREKYVASVCSLPLRPGDQATVFKYAVNLTNLDFDNDALLDAARNRVREAAGKGFGVLLDEHRSAWARKWEESDVVINGDPSAQQGIRFNIFQLFQTYTGEDERLNIGPKGFTGEKYGGSTYWDTEAFAFPFYLCTSDPTVARNLLLYRYKHLQKAIENAGKLGFTDGAALYPMVTMNGEECHNEWEITFEEIHRNGAIAYAIYNYIRHTGDEDYMIDHGLEVLIALSRFWKQRTQFSEDRKKYVILGVTGPNEYENNVNNNWYTNVMATWTLRYTLENIEKYRSDPRWHDLLDKLNFKPEEETAAWRDIVDRMHFPIIPGTRVFLQQDGYLDKEQIMADDLDPAQRPLNQHWSWDRILRSPFIKQADVLQGIYFFDHQFDRDTIQDNFNYYEPRTVHESSLSACIHAILAAKIGDSKKAYDLYLRTARLDLDDYNKEVAEGLHITSMAGTWLAIVEGFGGMRIENGTIYFQPMIPEQWNFYSFNVRYRGHPIQVLIKKDEIKVDNHSGQDLKIKIFDGEYVLNAHSDIRVKT
jgi:maltose phosphorylase